MPGLLSLLSAKSTLTLSKPVETCILLQIQATGLLDVGSEILLLVIDSRQLPSPPEGKVTYRQAPSFFSKRQQKGSKRCLPLAGPLLTRRVGGA